MLVGEVGVAPTEAVKQIDLQSTPALYGITRP